MNTHLPEEVRIAVVARETATPWLPPLLQRSLTARVCDGMAALCDYAPDLIVLPPGGAQHIGVAELRDKLPAAVLMAPTSESPEAEFPLPATPDTAQFAQLLKTALELVATRRGLVRSRQLLDNAELDLTRLADVGVALSAERDLNRLLQRILDTAQDIACCDAASLFLLDADVSPPQLMFKLTLNDSMSLDFTESRFEASPQSISGHVALTGESVILRDAYAIPEDAPYRFNYDFDRSTGYRTCSLSCIAMRDYQDNIVGVLQFINRKRSRTEQLSPSTTPEQVIAFDARVMRPLNALASLSAVAIQTRILIDSINNLFENFVQASVAAIEQRDPTTSGHSFRVADLSVALARALPGGARADLAAFNPDARCLRELRYASLLHDFGKVGVRENVLVKAKKLYESEFDALRYRLQLTRQRLRADAAEEIIRLYQVGRGDDQRIAQIRATFEQESAQLDRFLATIAESNEPSLLNADCKAGLEALRGVQIDDYDGGQTALLTPAVYEALSIPRGSLTVAERLEIESHVTHTFNFLKMIPWTEELAGVPAIAAKHHEKLNGQGYPDGLSAQEIPLQSRVMAICDIYDALTASDRPYKKAAPEAVAFRILREDAERGMLDADIVELFVGADIGASVRGKVYPKVGEMAGQGLHHSVCDHDTHNS